MSIPSLTKSIHTGNFNTANANRIESDRFLNPNNMVCIPPTGLDLVGRTVCRDSFYSKTPGCNSAMDRVSVESELRPNYAAYMNLNMTAINGEFYGCDVNEWKQSRGLISGSFGNQFQSTNYMSCPSVSGANNMAHDQENKRKESYVNNAFQQQQQNEYSKCGPY